MNFKLEIQSVSCKVLMWASNAWEYSRSACSSDCNFFTRPSKRIISILSFAPSRPAGALLLIGGAAAADAANVGPGAVGAGVAGIGIVVTTACAGADAGANTGAITGTGAGAAEAAIAGTGRGPGTAVGRGCVGGAADEKMLLRATAAVAADAGLAAGAPFGLSRCLTRAIRSCGWKGLRKSSSALTWKARSATARFTTPDIRMTGVFDNEA